VKLTLQYECKEATKNKQGMHSV